MSSQGSLHYDKMGAFCVGFRILSQLALRNTNSFKIVPDIRVDGAVETIARSRLRDDSLQSWIRPQTVE